MIKPLRSRAREKRVSLNRQNTFCLRGGVAKDERLCVLAHFVLFSVLVTCRLGLIYRVPTFPQSQKPKELFIISWFLLSSHLNYHVPDKSLHLHGPVRDFYSLLGLSFVRVLQYLFLIFFSYCIYCCAPKYWGLHVLHENLVLRLCCSASSLQRSSMGPAVCSLVGKRGRGENVSADLLERNTVDKVNILHVIFWSKLCVH